MSTVYVELWMSSRVSSEDDPDEWFDYLTVCDSNKQRTYWQFTSDLGLKETRRLVSEFVREHQQWYKEATKKVYQNNGPIFNITRFNVYEDDSDDEDSDYDSDD